MAGSDTVSGVTAYTSEEPFTGAEVWKSYKQTLCKRAAQSIMPILAGKGQKYGVTE